MRSKLFTTGLALAIAAGCACSAIAQVKPEQLVDQRVAAMRLQGKYLYPLLPMAQGRSRTTRRSSRATPATSTS